VSITAGGGITTAGDVTTTNDNVTFASATTLSGNVAVNTGAGAGNILFSSTVDGGQNLTLTAGTGNVTFTGAVGAGTSLAALTVNSAGTTRFSSTVAAASVATDAGGSTEINGNVTTTGTQSYGDDVLIDNGITLTTTNSNLTFSETVNSVAAEANALSINAGTGVVAMAGPVGGAAGGALGNFTVETASSFSANAITLADSRTLRLRSDDVAFGGTVLAPGGTIDVASRTVGRSVSLGSEVAGQLSLASAEIARLDTRAGAAGDGLVRITTSGTGDIALTNSVVLPGGALSVVSARNVTSTATIQTSGRVLVEAAGATGTLTVDSGSVTASGTAVSAQIGNKTFSIAEPATGLDVGADLRGRAGLVVLRANGDVTLKTATVNADALAIQSGATLSLGTVTATAGSAVTFTAPTAILATGTTRVLPRTAGRNPAVVYDTRLARPADPLALVVADVTGGAPSSQATQVRNGNAAGAFSDAPNAAAGGLAMQLDAGGSAAFLLVGRANVTGTISAGRLGVHGSGGTMTVTGSLAGKTGEAAPPLADITRPVTTSVLQKYKINDCVITSVSCVVAPSVQPAPPRPVDQVVLQVQGNRINPAEVVIPNASEAETE
jgi:hypothetical protein